VGRKTLLINREVVKLTKKLILILGGARSGKSTFAQSLAKGLGERVLYVATGEPLDEEMRSRIEAHKRGRPSSWTTLEIPTEVGRRIAGQMGDAEVVIIDCLTLLISNLLPEGEDYNLQEQRVTAEINELIDCIKSSPASFVIVSNEVGMGLVPANPLGRRYRDLLGLSNQRLAQHADEVYIMLAGIPVEIKALQER